MKAKKMPLETRRPASPPRVFPPRRDYASLSIKDLLDARDAYHVHLSTLSNVVATAIGRYFIHEKDWYAHNPPDRPRPRNVPRVTEARTLVNSVIRPWSWPAVIVFVRQWEDRKKLGSDMVPRTLYLADGRVVPTCVIEAAPDESLPPPPMGPFQASGLLGGGYACIRQHQGEQSAGTIACLVQKGGSYYALTNRHVAGGEGETVFASIRGQLQPIGATSNIAVDRQLLPTLFPAWAGSKLLLTLDAGLIRIDDINDWTSQAFGIGEIGELYDATEHTITLDLIGCPVRAFGGVSGVSEGEIRALFFRYESMGGYDYATDLLIGPRKEPKKNRAGLPFTRPGDSGTLWFYDPPPGEPEDEENADFDNAQVPPERGARTRRLRPLAMQWGGQRTVLPDGKSSAFALASFLSSICRSLDVEVVRNWSLGHDEFWGKIGHFSIGWKACDQLSGALGDLMKRNQANIGFDDDRLSEGSAVRLDSDGFVPLADVPDYVWVHDNRRPAEGIQHFADIDIYDIDGGPSMLEQCVADAGKIAAGVWKSYFAGFAAKGVGPEEGALPFRVWQIWEAMVDYLKNGDVKRFVAAAGVLAHYVGDASQPLHCSFMHHGVPPMVQVDGRFYPVPRDSDEFKAFKTTKPAKIHGIYEETMLEIDPAGALQEVNDWLAQNAQPQFAVANGHDAAVEVIQLMGRSQARLKPKDIIDADNPNLGPKGRATALWNNNAIRQATIESLADSVQVLAGLWQSAWKKGGGASIPKSQLIEFDRPDLEKVYRTEQKFLPSLSLDAMAQSGDFEP